MKSITVSLLDNNGNVQYGLNWGQRENRDPNQAYLQLTPEVYKSDYFPPKGKFFIADTDDNEVLIFNRAQKDYGCALQTPENNSIIGKYIRNRLGVASGEEITLDSIQAYGRNFITFYKVDDMHYKMDFSNNAKVDESRQKIIYGAPGTGKSHKISGDVKPGNHVRTTFHPDSDYATFVGAYKPTMSEGSQRIFQKSELITILNQYKNNGSTYPCQKFASDYWYSLKDLSSTEIKEIINSCGFTEPYYQEINKGIAIGEHNFDKGLTEKKIVYEFVAQAFLQAYTEAWKRSIGIMTGKDGKNEEMKEGMDRKYYLIIEEINRGNCAQIFGDIFQLLDRDYNGESSYAIRPDQDIKRYLADTFESLMGLPESIRTGEEMKLPGNLYIYATMNTSDQSLFPIDSAFKRRWDWEYVPITDGGKGYYIKVGDVGYLWSDFLKKINEGILGTVHSDDKQMGYWFVHLPEGEKEITTNKFVSKVLFYLWNDVFKYYGDGESTVFKGVKEDGSTYDLRFKDFFGSERDSHIHDFMRYNKIEPTEIEDDTNEQLSGENAPANGSASEWQAQFDNYWKGFQNMWDKDPNIKNRFVRFHSNAMILEVDGTDDIRMRFSLHPTNWHKVSINLRVQEGTAVAESLKANLDKIRELTDEPEYQYVVDRNYGLIQLRSNELDFGNEQEVAESYDWFLTQGEKLLSALSEISIINKKASKLRITLPNGEIIDEPKVVDTYLKYLELFNPQDIAKLNQITFKLPLISEFKQEGDNVKSHIQQKQLSNGWWVVCGNNASGYRNILKKVAQGLGDNSKIEVYEV